MPKDDAGASSTPWDSQIAHLVRSEGVPLNKARDRVVLDWLQRGDTRALAALLADGHWPGPTVRLSMALMLLDDADADGALARLRLDPELWHLPYRLVVKARPSKRKRPSGPDIDERGKPPAKSTGQLVSELAYEAAVARIDAAAAPTKAPASKPPVVKSRGGRRRKKSKK